MTSASNPLSSPYSSLELRAAFISFSLRCSRHSCHVACMFGVSGQSAPYTSKYNPISSPYSSFEFRAAFISFSLQCSRLSCHVVCRFGVSQGTQHRLTSATNPLSPLHGSLEFRAAIMSFRLQSITCTFSCCHVMQVFTSLHRNGTAVMKHCCVQVACVS